MNLDTLLRGEIEQAFVALFSKSPESIQLQPTNPEFEGSHTLVCFPLSRISGKNPAETAKSIGDYLVAHSRVVAGYQG
jgi:arginyl-tRNA synthetase